jgi:hypothetical protein
MAVTSGSVQCVQVGDDFGFVGIQRSDGQLEVFILWFGDRVAGPVGLWTAQLLSALTQRLPVDIAHAEDSAFIQAVTANAP